MGQKALRGKKWKLLNVEAVKVSRAPCYPSYLGNRRQGTSIESGVLKLKEFYNCVKSQEVESVAASTETKGFTTSRSG
jgi:hypothetical protein